MHNIDDLLHPFRHRHIAPDAVANDHPIIDFLSEGSPQLARPSASSGKTSKKSKLTPTACIWAGRSVSCLVIIARISAGGALPDATAAAEFGGNPISMIVREDVMASIPPATRN